MNMLSAKKVRLHGMQSSRWGTRDKLTQYKGLINLYTRDRKILSFDGIVARKKQIKELKQLRRDITQKRLELDNAVQGDRQQLRNTLAEHKDLQLAFQDTPAVKIIDHLHQGNFNKRKLLDRLDYRMKQKTQKLINYKLELAVLEDNITYEGPGQIPIECEAQIITGKVQDAILKKEAALACRQTYKNILTILEKDALFFDAVLETLKLDGFLQGRCMVRTTELGQLATEYLDDRKQEFHELEKAVKRDMKARDNSLQIVRQEVSQLTHTMSLLIRRDGDVNVGRVILPPSIEGNELQNDIVCIEKILKYLQEQVYVANFDNIFPCLQLQYKQTVRLQQLLEKCKNEKDTLVKKKEHGDTMYNELLYSMNETAFGYMSAKGNLIMEITKEQNRQNHVSELDLHQSALLVEIRASLNHLSKKCALINQNTKKDKTATLKAGQTKGILPTDIQDESLNIILQLEPKLQMLMSNFQQPSLEDDKIDAAYRCFQQLTTATCSAIEYEIYEVDYSFISDLTLEDSQVPTYSDIKAKSKELVDISTVDEDLVPMFAAPKKKFKFK